MSDNQFKWTVAENIVTMALAGYVFYLSGSAWSFLILLNLYTFGHKKKPESKKPD